VRVIPANNELEAFGLWALAVASALTGLLVLIRYFRNRR
jgi:hypothetical protein